MSTTTRQPRLLSLDDDEEIGKIVGAVAQKAEFDAIVTATAQAFNESLQRQTPDVIVLDLQMPEMDGIQMLRALGDRNIQAPIILVTGVDARTIASAEQYGRRRGLRILSTLQKPFLPEDLMQTLFAAKALTQPLRPADLAAAIKTGELVVHFQPVLRRFADGWDIDGVEALLRWEHPERGILTPESFLDLGDDRELSRRMTDFVIDQGLEQARGWFAAKLQLGLRINLSAALLTDVDFPDRLGTALSQYDIPGDSLTIEVNETSMLDEHPETFDILTRLRLKGVRLAIDDFGIGYSSLTQLFRMPFSEMKIDKSLIASAVESAEGRVAVEALIDLAHKLGLEVCAEGVENAESLEFLSDAHCDAAQGYLVSPPIRARQIAEVVRAWASRYAELSSSDAAWSGETRANSGALRLSGRAGTT